MSWTLRFGLGFLSGILMLIAIFLPWVIIQIPPIPLLGIGSQSWNGWEFSSQLELWPRLLEFTLRGKVSDAYAPTLAAQLPWMLLSLGIIICAAQLVSILGGKLAGGITLGAGLAGIMIFSALWGLLSFIAGMVELPLKLLAQAPGYGAWVGSGIYLGICGGLLGVIIGIWHLLGSKLRSGAALHGQRSLKRKPGPR